jgi:hypothetical protein
MTRTTYYYQVLATNATGTSYGAVESFTTQATPAVTTGVSNYQTSSSGLVLGTVNPSGLATTYHVAYVDQAGYAAALAESAANPYANGATTPESGSIGAGYEPDPVAKYLYGLKPETTYHYAVVATNTLGVVTGSDMTLTTTAAEPPQATAQGGASATSLNPIAQGPGGASVTPTPIIAWPAYVTSALNAPEPHETLSTPSTAKPLTKAQKLSKALRACHAKKGAKKAKCEAAAHKRYGPAKAKTRKR